ncbi:MAG: hypothetical protein KGL39_29035 [Patescibacteria group bacterium]|nr:hypothetical protein [Patescibacteria group bacterium]
MRPGGGRDKGSAFEREVAAAVANAFGVPRTQCYRTPLSGGHPFGDKGDLVIGPALLPRFPYCVECKRVRSFDLTRLMMPWSARAKKKSWLENKFIEQAIRQAQSPIRPLLVVRADHQFALAIRPWGVRDSSHGMCFEYAGDAWAVSLFENWLTETVAREGKVVSVS